MVARVSLAGLTLALLAAASQPAAPLLFLPNAGQAPPGIRYIARGSHVTALFGAGEVRLRAPGVDISLEFEGADPGARLEGLDRSGGAANFLIGNPAEWRLGVPVYSGTIYRGLYRGIDLIYRAEGRNLKSEFRVAPGAEPRQIRMRYAGADRIRLDRRGGLRIAAGGREWREQPPVIYQERAGGRVTVAGSFELGGDGTVGFTVNEYDRAAPLVIDPILYSTYLGGSNSDAATAVAVDAAGSVYVAGFTASTDFPTASPKQNVSGGGNDAFVAKLSPSGSGVVYCTYLGGSLDDRAYGIAVDPAGQAHVAGATYSKNFPVLNALQPKLAGYRNGFVAKLNAAGNGLVFSTYLGGSGTDAANGVAIDAAGSIYVTGSTTSAAFPTTTLQKTLRGGQEAFVSKLSADGARFLYSTFLGGSYDDYGAAIAVDGAGSAYVTGWTNSPDFPLAGGRQAQMGGVQDAFVARVSEDGGSLVFSTFLGGSGGGMGSSEEGRGIAVDAQGSVYVTGTTPSADFPVLNAVQPARRGSTDAFVTKMSGAGAIMYSTYLGGTGMETGNAIAVDATGNAAVAGVTYSTDFPVAGGFQAGNGGSQDAFIARLNGAGDTWLMSSYLGGNGQDTATAIAVDASSIYLAGWTLSTNFPLIGAFQGVNGGSYGAFVTRVGMGSAPSADSVTPSSGTGVSGTFQFHFSDTNGAAALTAVSALFNNSSSTTAACAVTYNVAANSLALLTDSGTAPADTISPGSGSQQNSQCTLSGSGSSVAQSGNTLTLTLAISFQPAFAGTRNVYGQAANGAGAGGWRLVGTWTISAPPPGPVSVTPASGSGLTQTFAFVYSDAKGYTAITTVSMVVNATISGVGSCYLYYNRSTNSIYLANDAGTAWTGPKTPGQSGTLQNSQCALDAGASSASGSGNTLTVNLSLTFQAAFSGPKNLYMEVDDGQDSGWQSKGTWTVAGDATGAPAAVSVSPASGSGASQAFIFVFSDPRGYTAISTVSVIVNSSLSGSNGCYLYFVRSANAIYLANDAGTAWAGWKAPGQSGTVQNSQCAVDAAASSVSGSGNNLTVTLALAFQPSFNGQKNIYMEVFDGQDSGWQQKGTWSASASAALGPLSVTPGWGGGASQTFSFVVADPKGYAAILSASVVVGSTLASGGTCYLYYARANNTVYLANDAGNAWLGSKALGMAGTLQNSQCALNAAASSYSVSGDNLTINLALSFLPGFSGTKAIFMEAFDGQDSGWIQKASWIVP